MRTNVLKSWSLTFFVLVSMAYFNVNVAPAQVMHDVSVTDFVFTPANLTINLGDTVRWTNATGTTHNVDGTQATFPSNPASFGNAIGTTWVYSFKFTVPGLYNYHCDVHFSFGMVGTVTVSTPSGITENRADAKLVSVNSNPAGKTVIFVLSEQVTKALNDYSINVYNSIGQKIKQVSNLSSSETTISTQNMPAGMYLYQLMNRSGVVETGKIMIE